MKPEAWTSVLRTNLDSAFHITQEVVKKMIRARWGRVINISSIVGLSGNPGQVNYAASKAALIGFTKSLALEIGSRNVTVNAIAPGFIQTAMTDAMTDDARKTLEARIALHRLGTPDDIAYAVVFLASEQAGYITGTVLNVSGRALLTRRRAAPGLRASAPRHHARGMLHRATPIACMRESSRAISNSGVEEFLDRPRIRQRIASGSTPAAIDDIRSPPASAPPPRHPDRDERTGARAADVRE